MKKNQQRGSQMLKEYFSVAELAQYSGISQRTLWDLLKDPVIPIPHCRIGATGRIVRVKKSEFDHWMKAHRANMGNNVDQIIKEILK